MGPDVNMGKPGFPTCGEPVEPHPCLLGRQAPLTPVRGWGNPVSPRPCLRGGFGRAVLSQALPGRAREPGFFPSGEGQEGGGTLQTLATGGSVEKPGFPSIHLKKRFTLC